MDEEGYENDGSQLTEGASRRSVSAESFREKKAEEKDKPWQQEDEGRDGGPRDCQGDRLGLGLRGCWLRLGAGALPFDIEDRLKKCVERGLVIRGALNAPKSLFENASVASVL